MIGQRIAVCAGKGGVGKTTVAGGLASAYAAAGKRTLLVDLDPQSNATWGLGGNPTSAGSYELLLGRTPEYQRLAERLTVLAGGPGLRSHEVMRLEPEALLDAFQQQTFFETVVMDCPPALDHLERLGSVASQATLVVLDAHPFAIQGAARVVADLEARARRGRTGARAWALVLSRLDLRRGLDRDLVGAVEGDFKGVPYFSVPQDTALAMSSTERQPLFDYAPTSRGAKAILEILKWTDQHAGPTP